MRQEFRAIRATAICFLVGIGVGTLVLWGNPRPVAGAGSVGIPAAVVAGVIAAATFILGTLLRRRVEQAVMPRWQRIISAGSAAALTVAFAGVTALGVLLASEILGVALKGLELPPFGGGIVIGIASAVGGRLAFDAVAGLRTSDLATLLLGYVVIGTLLAMLTATDPRWWELNFSQLGVGAGSWAFNGTLVVAGLLVATVGAYIGRDLHRLRGDSALGRIGAVVVLWSSTGVALAAVGALPVHRGEIAHNVATISTLVLFLAAAALTTAVMPGPPRMLVLFTIGVCVLLVVAVVLRDPLRVYSLTVLEVIVVGLGLGWMTVLVRTLSWLAPPDPRPSEREYLLHRASRAAAQ
ncbi:DUF998 domain-containing protein [Microbacterium sp. LWH12-1.2]|uniref:DUF998 domain-containing protein n=1 Tax=Microbacterium sp. LWH12-1.2 TaxID=3135259 RepID=UPI0034178AC6